MKATINNATIFIKPSKQLLHHISSMKSYSDMPSAFISFRSKETTPTSNPKQIQYDELISDEDRIFIKKLNLDSPLFSTSVAETTEPCNNALVNLEDLLWLWSRIQEENKSKTGYEKPYLHELLMGSEIVFPKNDEIPRSEELTKRCQLLRRQQENREYKAMTKNVDSVRKPHPEDTLSYQIKQINKQLIAVAQFIISVLAGFLFGFQGVELMVGSLDFGFRLLLGVICSLIIALAELYFLAKKLNEDLQYEIQTENKTVHPKND